MTNNDILRRLRYAFDFSDGAIVGLLLALVGLVAAGTAAFAAEEANLGDALIVDRDRTRIECIAGDDQRHALRRGALAGRPTYRPRIQRSNGANSSDILSWLDWHIAAPCLSGMENGRTATCLSLKAEICRMSLQTPANTCGAEVECDQARTDHAEIGRAHV